MSPMIDMASAIAAAADKQAARKAHEPTEMESIDVDRSDDMDGQAVAVTELRSVDPVALARQVVNDAGLSVAEKFAHLLSKMDEMDLETPDSYLERRGQQHTRLTQLPGSTEWGRLERAVRDHNQNVIKVLGYSLEYGYKLMEQVIGKPVESRHITMREEKDELTTMVQAMEPADQVRLMNHLRAARAAVLRLPAGEDE